jgi:hypothetical protein
MELKPFDLGDTTLVNFTIALSISITFFNNSECGCKRSLTSQFYFAENWPATYSSKMSDSIDALIAIL